MTKKKTYIITIIAALVLAVLIGFYSCYISPTKIATLNFPDFTVEKYIRSNNNPFVKIERLNLEDAENIKKYDVVLLRIHGSSLNATHLKLIEDAIEKGITVIATESDNTKINTLKGNELKYIATLLENSSVKNSQSMFNYIRKHIDKKIVSNKPYAEPIEVPSDYFFYIGDDNFFAEFEDYENFYKESGHYKEGAARVVVLAGNINMQNSNEEHMSVLINSLEDKGLNVYPINSFGMKKISMITAVKPDLIIYRPHGRLIMGGGDAGVDLLRTLNVPLLAPITVSELYEKWLKDKQGLTSGGMTSMSVVMPELDGAIVPFAIAAQFERNGMRIFDAIPQHTEKFCQMVKKFTELRQKPNSDKKVAIYYYKGTGKGSIGAAELEGVQSLYNTLKMLGENGYDVSGLPANAKELEKMVQKQGSVLGAYALGAYDEFIRNGNPELVEVDTFSKWANEVLPAELIEDMYKKHGEAPGKYMGLEKDGKKYIAVARLQFGNVSILPQPLPAEGEDIEAITHGVEGAPSYPYVASYLWARMGFKADALMHFGTHGNLEFIPGKQIALSDYDWTDALVGDMPHFYIYTINNIGEGIIAKRRSYATLVSHLTSPFMQGELYDNFRKIKNSVHSIELLEEGDVRRAHLETLTGLCKAENILSSLGIDSTKNLTNNDIDKIHHYVEEIDGAKVTDGLYTLGEVYTEENVVNTTRLMVIDNIRYALANIDIAHGRVKSKMLDNISFMYHKYTNKTDQIIKKAYYGANPEQIFASLVSKADYALLNKTLEMERKKSEGMAMMMKMAMGKSKEEAPKSLDVKGDLILSEAEEKEEISMMDMMKMAKSHASRMGVELDTNMSMDDMMKMKKLSMGTKNNTTDAKPMSMMDRMAQAKPQSDEELDVNSKDTELISALKNLKEAIELVPQTRKQLVASTTIEQNALLNALNGGYIHPSSAGDPIVNPKAVPTGKNFYSINPEATPSPEAWKVGSRLADNLLAQELTLKGKYPEKVSFTLWSSDFISSEGATIAQVLWLLGVEPLRDGFGYVRSLRLVPTEKLGRPRIDVVVQTSGQLRDIAASRLELINRAVAMAAADKSSEENYVRKGFEDAEKRLLEKGFSPIEARKYSKERVFGGAGGNYGASIMGMVEKGDSWDSTSQIARQYIKNMGALYSGNGTDGWGEMKEGVFEAALLNTSVVVQPRSSNTWGPLSLDHVYEFMGGLSAAVQHVTGEDPTAYFNDFRNTSRARVQGLKEAIGVETSSTIFNPKFIREKFKGEASSMAYFAETVRNTFGWNAMKPSAIDQHIWNKYHEIYVNDAYDMNVEKVFADKNPYALQELTAVMLESARKGMWKASSKQIKEVVELHTRMVTEHDAACSGFVCDNAKLRQFIKENSDESSAKKYDAAINESRQVQLNENEKDKSMVLEKEESTKANNVIKDKDSISFTTLYIVGGLLVLLLVWVIYRRKRALKINSKMPNKNN